MASEVLYADRVLETSTTTGTGTLTLAGASSGFQAFSSAFVTGSIVNYTIVDGSGNWEVGQGVYTTSGTTLSRVTVFYSSNSNALVNFPAGTKQVFNTLPANAIADMGVSAALAMRIVPQ